MKQKGFASVVILLIGVFSVLLLILALNIKKVDRNLLPRADPGNKHLEELANESIFAGLPPNATLSGPIVKTPAQWRQPGFQTGGWDGAGVVMMFVSKDPESTVYQFFATRAIATGWQDVKAGSNGFISTWKKTYSDGTTTHLSLYSFEDNPNGRRYELAGGI
jgi:hypothetical protein